MHKKSMAGRQAGRGRTDWTFRVFGGGEVMCMSILAQRVASADEPLSPSSPGSAPPRDSGVPRLVVPSPVHGFQACPGERPRGRPRARTTRNLTLLVLVLVLAGPAAGKVVRAGR